MSTTNSLETSPTRTGSGKTLSASQKSRSGASSHCDTEKSAKPNATHIAELLAIDIIDGRWPPTTSITLADIQQRFSVSRTIARETAQTLQSVQAVNIRKRVGLIAKSLDHWNSLDTQVMRWKLHSSHRKEQLLSLTELRLAVEPIAAEDAAQRAPIEVRALMPVLAMKMHKDGKSGNLEEFHQLDIRFHDEILKYSGNELFASLSPLVNTMLSSRVELGMYPAKPRPEALEAHDQVAEAIWKGEPDLAREAMTRIVDEVRTTTEQA